MAKIGAFMNLPSDSETDNRLQVLAKKSGLTPHDINHVHGQGVYSAYNNLALQLVTDNPTLQVFAATCWPTTAALAANINQNLAGIVFAGLSDSAAQRAAGYNPNVTGVRSFLAPTLCPNWPYLLTQIQPTINRIAVIYDQNPAHQGVADQLTAIQSVTGAPFPLPLAFTPIDARSSISQIESDINTFVAAAPNTSGLVVTSSTLTAIARRDITELAARYNLPAIYPNALFTSAGGLMSYGPDLSAVYETAATAFLRPILAAIQAGNYHPANTQAQWPIQTFDTPDKFDLIISRKAARGLGLVVANLPATFTVRIPWTTGAPQQIRPLIVP
jgi:ABC-type uncharacterized transport system substrate-binding protein